MTTTNLTKPFRKVVMGLNSIRPMNERERRKDMCYGIFLVLTFLLVPLIALSVAFAFGHYALGISITAASVLVGTTVGLGTRHKIIRSFFGVSDATGYLRVHTLEDTQLVERCKGHEILAITERAPEDAWHTFVYNWLCSREVLDTGTPIEAYRLTGQTLVDGMGLDLVADRDFLLVPTSQLHITLHARERLEYEMPFIGVSWLSETVKAFQSYKDTQTNLSLSQTPPSANKGQRLPRG